ncbi:hypothetical protein IJS77_01875 [bacterium]|nr:hypothetical protein [bacterium]
MEIFKKIDNFLKCAGYDKLFISFFPMFCSLVLAAGTFTFNYKFACYLTVAFVLLHLSIKIFDDFIDWIKGKPYNRMELEKTGVRGLYLKCSHFIENKTLPRFYFYCAFTFLFFSVFIIFSVCCMSKIYCALLFLLIIPFFALLNYKEKYSKIILFTGYEIFPAMICSFLSMFFIFWVSTRCITSTLFYISIISFFSTLNIFYTSSLLNQKADIISEKKTLPIIIKNENLQFIFSSFLTLFPFILVGIGIFYDFLPKLSEITILLIPFSIWFLYLIYLFIKKPQQTVKWHFLMGFDGNRDCNEQNNLSWYFVRYNFLRNIFISFYMLLSISFINFKELFMF